MARKPKKMVEAVDVSQNWNNVQVETEDYDETGDVYADDIEDEVHEVDKYDKEAEEWLNLKDPNHNLPKDKTFHGIKRVDKD